MSYKTQTIAVEPENENLSDIDLKSYSDCMNDFRNIYGNILFSSLRPEQTINTEFNAHPVYEGFISAYKNHRPITISPDIFWLLIIQAFSNHVSSKSNELRHMFVNFSGKQKLHVIRRDLLFYKMTANDWETIFPDLVLKIAEYTGEDITNILKPDFTTTTPVSLAVGQLTIMSTMQHFFEYKVSVMGCGFPHITIEGSIEDWEKIVEKLSNLAKYKFEWFTEETIPIINEIIKTKKGKINIEFWKKMLKIKNRQGAYNPGYVDGWITKFFPFDKNGNILHGFISERDELQKEVQEIPFELEIIGQCTFKCIFLAGFVGVSQDEKNKKVSNLKLDGLLKKDNGSIPKKAMKSAKRPPNRVPKKVKRHRH